MTGHHATWRFPQIVGYLFTKRQRRDMAGPGVAVLSGLSSGFEAGREPGVAIEQVAEGVEFADPSRRWTGMTALMRTRRVR